MEAGGMVVSRTGTRKWGWWAGVGCVTLLALVLRGWHLDRRGVLGHDEAVLMLEAGYMLGLSSEDRPIMAHPWHTAILALASRLFGWSDGTGLRCSAVLGAATVPAVAWIGRAACGPAAGLAGALVLAVSPFHIRYSRSVGSDVIATFFLTLAIGAGLRAGPAGRPAWWARLAVASASAAALSHYRYFPPAAVVAGWVAWRIWLAQASASWRALVIRLAGLMLAGVFPLLIMEAWYSWPSYPTLGPLAYLQQLRIKLEFGRDHAALAMGAPLSQMGNLWALDGPVLTVLASAGSLLLARPAWRGDHAARVLLLWFLVPVLIWSVYHVGWPSPRVIVMALPAAAILAGVVVERVARWLGGRVIWPHILGAGLVVLAAAPRVLTEIRMQSGYRQAVLAVARDAVRRGEPAKLHWYYGPVWRLYMLEAAKAVGRPAGELLEVVYTTAPPTFYNYAIVDPYVYALDPGERERLDRLTKSRSPLGEWSNTWADDPQWLGDMALDSQAIRRSGGKRDLARLRVYRWPG